VEQQSCLIIGGGISGLMAGTVLQRQGIHVTLLDKGRGIGGRLATRRISHPVTGEGVFDYGAQYFTVSHPLFQQWVDDWLQQGIVGEWSQQLDEPGRPCYRGSLSNRSIAKFLAQNLEVHTQARAVQITWESSQWLVRAENGASFQGDRLLITSPVPQTLALLNNSAIALPTDLKNRLEQITYHPCIAVLALLEKPAAIPEPGGLRLNDSSLAWIACNRQKGISPQANAATLHATPAFSQIHWETDNATTAKKLFEIASPWLGSSVVDYQVHRWRYSQPQTCFGEAYLGLREPGLFALAGDAFSTTPLGEPSTHLEKAALSGLAAADYLLKDNAA
jgi:predicted NAD/FAD-dependent oxidoreductase